MRVGSHRSGPVNERLPHGIEQRERIGQQQDEQHRRKGGRIAEIQALETPG